jgi:hypothetical protein
MKIIILTLIATLTVGAGQTARLPPDNTPSSVVYHLPVADSVVDGAHNDWCNG